MIGSVVQATIFVTDKQQEQMLNYYTACLKKTVQNCLSELCQISTNFDNFWQNDSKEAKIMRDPFISHLT